MLLAYEHSSLLALLHSSILGQCLRALRKRKYYGSRFFLLEKCALNDIPFPYLYSPQFYNTLCMVTLWSHMVTYGHTLERVTNALVSMVFI